MTKDALQSQLDSLLQQRQQCANQFHELNGAVQICEHLLRQWDVEPPKSGPQLVKELKDE